MTTMPGDTIPGYLSHTTDELLDELAAEGFHYITIMVAPTGRWQVTAQRPYDGPTFQREWVDGYDGNYATTTTDGRTTLHVTYTAPTRHEALAHLLALVDVAILGTGR